MPQTYRDRFIALAAEMEALAAGLNTHSTECECCHAQRFDAFEEELTARKLLGYADSFAKMAEATSGRGKDSAPAPFLTRVIAPETMSPAAFQALTALSDRDAKWAALYERVGTGDDMRAVCRDVSGLIQNREHEGSPIALKVLAAINPWLREQGVTPSNLRDKLAQ